MLDESAPSYYCIPADSEEKKLLTEDYSIETEKGPLLISKDSIVNIIKIKYKEGWSLIEFNSVRGLIPNNILTVFLFLSLGFWFEIKK